MFLIRTAFWLSLVILLLPAGNSSGDAIQPAQPDVDVTAGAALGAARDTIADFSAFCLRNPDTCATGSAALRVFGQKAQNGARMVYEYLADLQIEDDLGRDRADSPEGPGTDTLRAEDLEIPWQGPESQG
jgi:hypothetical protein